MPATVSQHSLSPSIERLPRIFLNYKMAYSYEHYMLHATLSLLKVNYVSNAFHIYRHESRCIRDIAVKILNKLGSRFLVSAETVGVEPQVENVMSLLTTGREEDVRIIGNWCMGALVNQPLPELCLIKFVKALKVAAILIVFEKCQQK